MFPSAAASSPASVPSTPPVSPTLAADVRARFDAAHTLFPKGHPIRVVGDRFVLVDVDAGPSFGPSVTLADQALAVLYDGRLFALPERGVTVWLFGTHDRYESFRSPRAKAVPHRAIGLYDPNIREIFVDIPAGGITTEVHEIMHPLLESDFPHAPPWLVEGMASLYELPDLTVPGEIHGKPDPRLSVLRQALASPVTAKSVTLDALFVLRTREDWEKDLVLHYAEAREALRWLDANDRKLWPFYQEWRTHVLDDPTGEKSFARVVGATPAEASAAWLAWVKSAAAGPGPAGLDDHGAKQ